MSGLRSGLLGSNLRKSMVPTDNDMFDVTQRFDETVFIL